MYAIVIFLEDRLQDSAYVLGDTARKLHVFNMASGTFIGNTTGSQRRVLPGSSEWSSKGAFSFAQSSLYVYTSSETLGTQLGWRSRFRLPISLSAHITRQKLRVLAVEPPSGKNEKLCLMKLMIKVELFLRSLWFQNWKWIWEDNVLRQCLTSTRNRKRYSTALRNVISTALIKKKRLGFL